MQSYNLVNFKLWEPLTVPGSQLRDLDFCICRTPLWEYTAKAFTNTTQFLHFAAGIHCQTIHEYHSVPVSAGHQQHLLFASAVFCWGEYTAKPFENNRWNNSAQMHAQLGSFLALYRKKIMLKTWTTLEMRKFGQRHKASRPFLSHVRWSKTVAPCTPVV